jgi:DNA-binding XRE family transcriptional regulator
MTAPKIDLEQMIADRLATRDDDLPYDREAVEKEMAAEIGEAVQQLRQHVRLNQTQLAALMNASQPTVNRIETGAVIAGLPTLVRMLRALDVPHLYIDLTPDGINIDVKKSLRTRRSS